MKKQHSDFFWLIVFIIGGIYLLIFVLVFISRDDWKSINNNPTGTGNSLDTGSSITENITGDIIQPIDTKTEIIKFIISNGCNLSGMNSITLASEDDRFYTTEPPKTSTKRIKTNGNLGNVFICITPDISNKKDSYNNYRKNYSYNAVTYIKVGDYEGFYDVGYSLESNLFYDLDSNNSKKVNKNIKGKYRTHELPLLQLIDTSENIFLADTIYGGTKQVNLESEFKDGKIINVGAYMTKLGENAYRASSIKEFKIIRDGDGYIEIIK